MKHVLVVTLPICLLFVVFPNFTVSVRVVQNGFRSEKSMKGVECLAKILCKLDADGASHERRSSVITNFYSDNGNPNEASHNVPQEIHDYSLSLEELQTKEPPKRTSRLSSKWSKDFPSSENNASETVPKERIARAMKILKNRDPRLQQIQNCEIAGCSFTTRQLMAKFGSSVYTKPKRPVQYKPTPYIQPAPVQPIYHQEQQQYYPQQFEYPTMATPTRNTLTNKYADEVYDYNEEAFDDELQAHSTEAQTQLTGGVRQKGDTAQGLTKHRQQLWADYRPRPPPPPPFWMVKRPEGFWEPATDRNCGGKKGKGGKGKGKGKKGKGKCKGGKGKKGKGKGKGGKKGQGWQPSSSEEEQNTFFRRLHYFLREQQRINDHKAALSLRIGGRPMTVHEHDTHVPVRMSPGSPHLSDIARPINTAYHSLSRLFGRHSLGDHGGGGWGYWRQG